MRGGEVDHIQEVVAGELGKLLNRVDANVTGEQVVGVGRDDQPPIRADRQFFHQFQVEQRFVPAVLPEARLTVFPRRGAEHSPLRQRFPRVRRAPNNEESRVALDQPRSALFSSKLVKVEHSKGSARRARLLNGLSENPSTRHRGFANFERFCSGNLASLSYRPR